MQPECQKQSEVENKKSVAEKHEIRDWPIFSTLVHFSIPSAPKQATEPLLQPCGQLMVNLML